MLWKPKWKTQQKCDKVLGKKKKKVHAFYFTGTFEKLLATIMKSK